MNSLRWAPIPGYNDRYEVSDQGDVRSRDIVSTRDGKLHIRRGKLLKAQNPRSRNKARVALHDNGRWKLLTISSLVAAAFVGGVEKVERYSDAQLDAIEIAEMWCGGHSCASIAKELGWTTGGVRKYILRSETLPKLDPFTDRAMVEENTHAIGV